MVAHQAEQEQQEEELKMLRQQRDLLKKLLQQQKQVTTIIYSCVDMYMNFKNTVDNIYYTYFPIFIFKREMH